MASFESPATPDQDRKVILSCHNLWKVFGAKADKLTKPPTQEHIEAAGLIVGVRDASLDIRQGEIFVIMGLSGSGKSTLVRCLSRLLRATLGRVMFDGNNLLDMPDAELKSIRRHRMGMVFQNFALMPHLTVLGNVTFPLEVQRIGKTQRVERAMQMIRRVGLEGREDYYPHELSGGQQQRVGIARSLAGEPEIWFLDEPFSALDPLIRHEMQNEFMRLQSDLRKTIVFITHDFNEAVRLADRIAIMKDGEIVQVGTPEDLVLTPATGYVQEFTKSISRARVLSVEALMQPLSEMPEEARHTVHRATKIDEAAAQVLAADCDLIVTDSANRPLGRLRKSDVFRTLAGQGST